MHILRFAVGILILTGGCSAGSPTSGSDEGDAKPFVEASRAADVGRTTPDVTLELLNGSHVALAALRGRQPVYLKFWATWCIPCREQMPHLQATFDKYHDKLAIYAIDVGVDDTIENVREFATTRKLTVPIAYDRDGSASQQFFLNVTPQHVLIDRSGIVRHVGHAVTPELEGMIAALAGDNMPAIAPTATNAQDVPTLLLDDGSELDLAAPRRTPLALTFVTLFCDSYIAASHPETGAACAARARQVEQQHRTHPDIKWVVVAYPVWTDDKEVAAFRKRLDLSMPIGIDRGTVWFRRFAVRDSYTTVLLDVAGRELGRVDGDANSLAALIENRRAPIDR
jgi:peroxiredoxin